MSKPNDIKGVGIGLRSNHYHYVIQEKPKVSWFEVLTDNYLSNKGIPFHKIDKIREDYPMTLHGVGLSLGSSDAINKDYLKKILALIERWQPNWVSDHLCWSSINGTYLHELLPLPYTAETLQHLINRINTIQQKLPCPLLIENVSSYLNFKTSEYTEWDFLNILANKTGCKILLDVNNIYVSSKNHSFDANDFLQGIDTTNVGEIHLAGYLQSNNLLIDTHGARVSDPVWELFQKAISRFGKTPTLIEWDNDIPDFTVLMTEAEKAQQVLYAKS